MTRETFNIFFKEILSPIANRIKDESINNNSVCFTENADGLYECYLLKKNALRIILKDPDVADPNNTNSDQESDDLLDRHKVAACMTIAIIEIHMFSNKSVSEPKKDRYLLHDAHRLNEQLALQCGIAVLSMYMSVENAQNKHAINEIRRALDQGFVFPPAVNSKSCPDSFVRALFYSGFHYGLNPILLASIFFMLEQYFYTTCGVALNAPPLKDSDAIFTYEAAEA